MSHFINIISYEAKDTVDVSNVINFTKDASNWSQLSIVPSVESQLRLVALVCNPDYLGGGGRSITIPKVEHEFKGSLFYLMKHYVRSK